MTRNRLFLFILIAGFLCAYPLGLHAEYNAKYKLDITNIHVSDDGQVRYIAGTIANKSPQDYAGVQITFDLIDEEGSVVAQTMDSVMNFKSGSKWKFKCPITDESAKNFRISGIEVIE